MTFSTAQPHGLPIGEQLGFLEYLVTDEKLQLCRKAAQYSEAKFPNVVAREPLAVLLQNYNFADLDSVTHTDHYFRPPELGRRVQVTGWIRDRRRERGTERLVVDTFAVDEIGTEILRSRHTFRIGAARAPERLGRRTARSPRRTAAETLPALHKRITEETIECFERAHRELVGDAVAASTGGSQGNLHISAGLASGMGLAATVAPGELGLACLHELLDRRFGIDFRQGGSLTVNFRRPIYAGDNLTAQGQVTARETVGERETWRLLAWLENQRGEQVITGDAQVTVPSPLT